MRNVRAGQDGYHRESVGLFSREKDFIVMIIQKSSIMK